MAGMTKFIYKHKYLLSLILIIAIAIFFRFWQFGSVPSGLYQDEAMNGADALTSLESGNFRVFYSNNNGREGMIVWLDVLAIKLFGTEPWVLRVFPAAAGVLAVLGLYFLTKLLFNPHVALASSFFIAISFWAVNFSRIGFRAGLMLPFLIWSFYFLWRGLDKKPVSDTGGFWCRTPDFIIAGILFGLGFYTYISYRFAPVLVAMFFIPYLIRRRVKNLWLGFVIFAIVAFIVALPIGLYFLNNPGDFFGRSGQVAIWSAENPFKAAILSIVSTLGMFNIIGDFNWRHNFANSPQLFWPVGILFLIGLGISIKRLRFSEKFMLMWLGIFLLPNILAAEGNPHALRALGAMPAAMVFAGIGLVWIWGKVQRYKKVFILLIIFLLFIGFSEFNKYFVKWASDIHTVEAFSQNQVKIADYLNRLPQDVKKYAIWPSNDQPTENGLPISAQTVFFLTYKKSEINYLKFDKFDKINLGKNGTVIAPIYFDLELPRDLNKKFSNGKVEFIYLNTPVLIVP